MLSNYLKTALRHLWKFRFYSFINIFGLALGLACFLFILLYVVDELRYDRFHADADRIYRMDFYGQLFEQEIDIPQVGDPWGPMLLEEFPEVEQQVRLRERGHFLVRYEDRAFREEAVVYADSGFFELFSFDLLQGDATQVLSEPNTVVITSELADKYFGSTDPIGKSLTFDDDLRLTVSGVMAPMPRNSHFRFDVLISMATLEESRSRQWLSFNFHTYLKVRSGTDPTTLESRFEDIARTQVGSQLEQFMGQRYDDFLAAGNVMQFSLFPLTRIHLHAHTQDELGTPGDIRYVYIFAFIGGFILLLACINFMNLSTARSGGRAREVGMRKVVGARRGQLIQQFLSESMLISLLALLLAVVLLVVGLPGFNQLADKDLRLADLLTPWLLLSMIGLTALVGLLAGSYPALFLSGFRTIRVLKGTSERGSGSVWFRNGLVVFQFGVTVMLIVGTLVVFDQLRFMQQKKLGFQKERLLILNDAYALGDGLEAFRQEALRDARVERATVTSFLPTPSSRNSNATFLGRQPDPEHTHVLQTWYVDEDFVETLGLELVEGRDFSRDRPADSSTVVLNQRAVEIFGLDDPLDQEIGTFTDGNPEQSDVETYRVIGVVRDFHFESMRQNIAPLVMYLGRSRSFLALRVQTDEISGLIAELKSRWERMADGQPFDYHFLDDRFEAMYRGEERVGHILSLFTGLAILIACLGLFGLASFMAERRTKEIGIRKVLGAPVSQLFLMLTSQFTRWVFLASILALPLAYLGMRRWLEGFAYQAGISPWSLLAAVCTALCIALLTVSYQAIRVARVNPVRSLRYE